MTRTLATELRAAADNCRAALAEPPLASLGAVLPDAPASAEAWFELLAACPHNADAMARIEAMKAAVPAALAEAGAKVEYFAALQALSVAAPRAVDLSLPDTVKRHFAAFCNEVAAREPQWENHYDTGDAVLFDNLVHMATLRRFPVGELNFNQSKLPALYFALLVHPLDLPSYLATSLFGLKGTQPLLSPHINYGRKASLVLRQDEFERSLWRMAKVMEQDQGLKGLLTLPWLCSAIVGETFPTLAWVRRLFVDGGAYLVDLDPQKPEPYGFTHNSLKRRKLYERGDFCPRRTLVLWPRDDVLAWAASRPELADEGEIPVEAPRRRLRFRAKARGPARHARQNGFLKLWNGSKAYHRLGKLTYVGLALLAPALVLAAAAGWLLGPLAALPVLPFGLWAAHAFQYYFAQ